MPPLRGWSGDGSGLRASATNPFQKQILDRPLHTATRTQFFFNLYPGGISNREG